MNDECRESTTVALKRLLTQEALVDKVERQAYRKEMQKKFAGPPRMPNKEFIERVDYGFKVVRGQGLSEFLPAHKVGPLDALEQYYFTDMPAPGGGTRRRACILNSRTGARRLALVENLTADGSIRAPVWHVISDLGSVGFPGLAFLKNCVQLRMTALPDRLHQIVNCWQCALTSARLTLKRLEFKPLCDLRFGPWASQAHHGTLRKCAQEFFEVQDWRSPLFQMFYDEVAAELDCADDPAMGSEGHQREVWQRFRAKLLTEKQGAHLREGRWWNVESRGLAVTSSKTCLLVLLLYLGFQRRWWVSFGESPLGRLDMFAGTTDDGEGLQDEGDGDDSDDEGGDEELEEQDAAASAASRGNGLAEQGASSKEMSKAASREQVRKRRKRTANALHYSCLLLAEQTSTRIFQGMCQLSRPLMHSFGEEEKLMMTRAGTKQLFAKLSRGSYQETLLQMFEFFFSAEFTHAIGLRHDRTSAHQIKADNMLIRTLWVLVLAAIGQLATFNTMHYVFPLFLIGLIDDDQEPGAICRHICIHMQICV